MNFWRWPLVFLLFGAVPAFAADSGNAGSIDDSESGELPVVLTPSRLAQPLNEAPAAMTVIDRATIEASGYRDLPRLLRLVPGMQVGSERRHAHWVTYHGMGNDFPSWMQVLVDGRSTYSAGNFNGVDWPGLPVSIDEIERIEVLRGTNSAAYGSNAFLGVVNIITRDSQLEPGVKATVHAGSADIRDAAVELGRLRSNGGLRLNLETRRDDGFNGLYDGSRFTLASLRADTRLGNHDELMLRLSANRGKRELGYADSTFNNNGERTADSSLSALHLQWKHAPSVNEEWLLSFYRNEDHNTDEWIASAQPGADVPLNRNRKSERNNLELQHRLGLSEHLRLLWGMELRRDEVHAPFLYFGAAHQDSDLKRLFGQLDWNVKPGWNLNSSALIEKFDEAAVHVSPRLFSNWQLDSGDTLRLGYARAWRPPNLFERNGDIRAYYNGALLVHPYLPNPDLKPASIDSLELGYLGRLPAWNARLDVRLFEERISHYITRVSHPEYTAPILSSDLPSARYENLNARVHLRGIEYQIDSRPRPSTRLLFSHTLIRRQSDEPSVTRLTAPFSASLNWMEDWGHGWSSMLSAYCMGPLAGGSGFVPRYEYASPAYTTFDARVGRRFRMDTTPVEIALVATNLGGRHQEIADRSEQFLHGSTPANRTSPMVWLTFSVKID